MNGTSDCRTWDAQLNHDPFLQIEVSRFNAFLSAEAAAAKAEDAAEVTLWAPGARGTAKRMHPLSMYDVRTTGSIGKGKGMVDPKDVIAYEARPLLWSRA